MTSFFELVHGYPFLQKDAVKLSDVIFLKEDSIDRVLSFYFELNIFFDQFRFYKHFPIFCLFVWITLYK